MPSVKKVVSIRDHMSLYIHSIIREVVMSYVDLSRLLVILPYTFIYKMLSKKANNQNPPVKLNYQNE